MSKKSFLFYPSDFIGGVQTMTFEDRGKYITLLSLMSEQGRMDEGTINAIIGSMSKILRSKFVQDKNGLLYNKRLDAELNKRKNINERNKKNGQKGGRPIGVKNPKKTHWVNLDENVSSVKNNELQNIKTQKKPTGLFSCVTQIIEYLNQKTGQKYRHTTKSTISHINARISEGFTIEDFKKVIDTKVADWAGSDWSRFLRPETLFGTKFEGYLNQNPKQATTIDKWAESCNRAAKERQDWMNTAKK